LRAGPPRRRSLTTSVLVLAALALPAAASATSAEAASGAPSSSVTTLKPLHARSFHTVSVSPGTRSGGPRTAAPAPAPRLSLLTSTPTASFTINYIDDKDATGAPLSAWNASAKAAFQAAANIWGREIQSRQPLIIDAHSTTFGDPAVLGGAGPGDFISNSMGTSSTADDIAYPLAQIDAQRTTRFEGVPDIYAEFNPNRSGLYFGTDGATPSGSVDFESVVLHEITHGLGFSGAGDVDSSGLGYNRLAIYDSTGNTVTGYGPPTIFDTLTYGSSASSTTPITAYTNKTAPLGVALQGYPSSAQVATNGVYWSGRAGRAGAGGAAVRLYAPHVFQEGSSYSHLDESTYSEASGNALMTPAIAPGEPEHDPGPITLGMLSDMGYAMHRPVIAVHGTDNSLYVMRPGTSFVKYGGQMLDAPAVASAAGRDYYVVRGTDSALYVRTDTTGFTRLVTASTYCIQPDAATNGTVLTVGCKGREGSFYAGSMSLPATGNPVISALAYQGGRLNAGPALGFNSSGPFAIVVGATWQTNPPANTYFRQLSSPPGSYSHHVDYCSAQLAESLNSSTTAGAREYAGCQYPTDHSLQYRVGGSNGGAGRDGKIIGRPGLARTPDGSSAQFFVQGNDGAIYVKTVSPNPFTATSFRRLGGAAIGGVGATEFAG